MKRLDSLRRSGRNLKSAKVRTILTALAIAVGAFTLTLTLAASNGLRNYTDKLISSNFDPAELFIGRDPEVSNTGTPSEKPREFDQNITSLNMGAGGGNIQIEPVTIDDVRQLRSLPYVEQVREGFQINLRYVTREGQKKFTGSGEAYNPAQKPEIKAGQLPPGGDIATGTLLLPESYLQPLGFSAPQEALGEKVQVAVARPFNTDTLQALQNAPPGALKPEQLLPEEKIFTFRVGAIVKKSATSLMFGVLPLRFSAADAKTLYDYTTEGTIGHQQYMFVYARIKDGDDPDKLQQAKNDLQSKEYYVLSSRDIQKTITQFVDILTIMVGVFGLITVIASVFGIINTQYISVLERVREIGLMKALGMKRGEVSRLFTYEAAWIGFIGGVVGAAIGLLTGMLLNPWITDKLDLGEGSQLLVFNPLQIILLIIALMLVATLAGLLPARKAAKLDPIEALRTE